MQHEPGLARKRDHSFGDIMPDLKWVKWGTAGSADHPAETRRRQTVALEQVSSCQFRKGKTIVMMHNEELRRAEG